LIIGSVVIVVGLVIVASILSKSWEKAATAEAVEAVEEPHKAEKIG
jgi:hypothetical protein